MEGYEKLENSKVRFTVTVDAQTFNESLAKAFTKNAKYFNVPGFRKGKAPRSMVESIYGEGVLYDDAVEFAFPDAFEARKAQLGIKTIGRPEIVELKEIGKDMPLVMDVEIDVPPTIELCEYKGIEVPKGEYTVTDAEVEEQITKERRELSRYEKVERPSANGDAVIIDYCGSIDGVNFEGGTAENQTVELGKDEYIPGFLEQIVGMSAGEEKDIDVTFPENYGEESLSGKAAVFHIVLHEVCEVILPEADDDFAKDVSEFDTFEEYRNNLRSGLEVEKKRYYDDYVLNTALEKIAQDSKFDIPQTLIEDEIDESVYRFERNIKRNGMNIEAFLKMTDSTMEKFRDRFKDSALNSIKGRLIIDKIGELEAVELNDEEKEAALSKELETAGMGRNEFDASDSKDMLLSYIYDAAKRDKASQLLVDSCVMVEKHEDDCDCGHDHVEKHEE